MPSPRFALKTEVPEQKTRQEIEALLHKYGAESFLYGTQPGQAVICFRSSGRHYRFLLPLPGEEDFSGAPAARQRALAQSLRSCWRSLLLLIKAKLEAVERQVASFEEEFGNYALLPNGQTVAEWIAPQLAAAYESGRMPSLMSGAVLPALGDGR